MRSVTFSLSLFLVVLVASHAGFVVDAFQTVRRIPVAHSHLWSKTVLEEETTATSLDAAKDDDTSPADPNSDADINAMVNKSEEETDEENMMQKIKDSGLAGVISYAAWELAFWTVSVPVCVLGYKEVTGHWPDLQDKDDLSKLGAEAFAFVNFARFAVPLRIGLALGTTPWIQENIVDVFFTGDDDETTVVEEKEEKTVDESESVDASVAVVETKDEDAEDSSSNAMELPNGDDSSEDEPVVVAVAVEDEPVVAVAVEEEDDSSKCTEEEPVDEPQPPVGRFRIRTRIGNLANRILRRNTK